MFLPDDFVRIEIAAALDRNICVVPVLIDGATMPTKGQLPASLQRLVNCQAIWLRHDRFSSDVLDLAKSIRLEVSVWGRCVKILDSVFASPPVVKGESRGSSGDAPLEPPKWSGNLTMTDVNMYVADRLVLRQDGLLRATSLYEDYCTWCDERGKEPLALPTFGREIAEYGIQKVKKPDGVRYSGVALRDVGGSF